MHLMTQLFEIESAKTVLSESFSNNKRRWETIDSEKEYAQIINGAYCIENRSESDWNYYSCRSGLKEKDDFLINAFFDVVGSIDFGHFGLVWGFDGKPEYLNKFSVAPLNSKCSVMSFEKDYRKVLHRFYDDYFPDKKDQKKFRLTIIKLDTYFYFLCDEKLVYQCHEHHFTEMGKRMGIYIEPGLSIRVSKLEIKKITCRKLKVLNGLDKLLHHL